MAQLRLCLIGGHDFTVPLDTDDAAATLALVTSMWERPEPLGSLHFEPEPGVTLRVSLRDIVAAELTE